MISPLFFENPEQLCIDEQTRVDEVFIQTHHCSGCLVNTFPHNN